MYYEKDENLAFLKDKISEIKIALFKSDINSELTMPNNIVQTLRFEEDGTLWFFTTCKGNYARFIDKSFYAHLSYYKKDTGCRLELGGKAKIVDNSYEGLISSGETDKEGYTSVLVEMKIMQAEYFENKVPAYSWTDRIRTAINSLFLQPSHRIYNFS
jgi:hypothetical protein